MAETTQRAYKFFLAHSEFDNALKATHIAVNAGAGVALDWMLNLAGGFNIVEGVDWAARTMLSRCWLSVESRDGAPEAFIVPHTVSDSGTVMWHTEHALDEILAADGLDADSRAAWIAEVRSSINAALRKDAVWVNRRAAFNALVQRVGAISQADLDDFFFGSGMLERERFFAVDIPPKAPDCMQGIGNFLSRRAGTGTGSNFAAFAQTYAAIAQALDGWPNARHRLDIAAALSPIAGVNADPNKVLEALSIRLTGPGHKSATKNALAKILSANEPIDDVTFEKFRSGARADAQKCAKMPAKGGRAYSDAMLADVAAACGFSYAGKPARHAQYAVMFDQAARRFAGVQSFTRNAERDRAALDLAKLEAAVPPDAMAWCEAYAAENGAIRRKALGRWKTVVERWETCADALERMDALRAVQRERNREKMGYAALFAEIGVEEAAASLRADASALPAYVKFAEARDEVAHRKAPMLRHIHWWHSPAWAEFGTSRLDVSMTPKKTGATIALELLVGSEFATVQVDAQCRRFWADIGEHIGKPGITVSRGDRLGRIAADASSAEVSLGSSLKWNGKLHFTRPQRGSTAAEPTTPQWTFSYSAPLEIRKSSERVIEYQRSLRTKNTARGAAARLNFGRLPGVRILGVQTAVKIGAACAVLETISREDLEGLASAREAALPGPDDMGYDLVGEDGKHIRFRRIAGDTLADGSPHPCPWAKIEGDFLIRLPGENRDDVRRPTPGEIAMVQDLARMLRVQTRLARRVTELQKNAIRTVRLALAAHGRLASPTYVLSQYAFGGASIEVDRVSTALERLQKAAVLDPDIAQILAHHPATPEWKPEKFQPLVGQLTNLWNTRDPLMQAALGSMRKWLLPSSAKDAYWTGGLSLARIQNFKELHSAQYSFAMRPHPLHARARENISENYGFRCLEQRNRLRRERTRALAARVIEAALGGQRTSSRRDSETNRSTERLYPPVDVIVIEDLDNFKSSQTRDHRTNRNIIDWAHSDLEQNIEQAWKLHSSIPVRKVVAAYTSQENGRTGAPGIRARRLAVDAFIEAPWSQREIEDALKRRGAGNEREVDRLLIAWWSRWNPDTGRWLDENGRTWTRRDRRWTSHTASQTEPPPILLPDEEGPLFIALDALNPVDANTNAAITVGTRPLLDPDWAGSWSHVSTESGEPVADKIRGAACFKGVKHLEIDSPKGKIVNAWRTRSNRPLAEDTWLPTGEYFASVREEIARRLREQLETRSASQTTA